jgi:uncharacterized membrane protein YgcG
MKNRAANRPLSLKEVFHLNEAVKMKIDASTLDFLKAKMKEVQDSSKEMTDILEQLQYFSKYNQDYVNKATVAIADAKRFRMPLLSEIFFGESNDLMFLESIDRKYDINNNSLLTEIFPALAPLITAAAPALKTIAMTVATDLMAKHGKDILKKVEDKANDYIASKVSPIIGSPAGGGAATKILNLVSSLGAELAKSNPDLAMVHDFIEKLRADGVAIDDSDILSKDFVDEIEATVASKGSDLLQQRIEEFKNDIKKNNDMDVVEFKDGFVILTVESAKGLIRGPVKDINDIKKTFEMQEFGFADAAGFKAFKDPKYKPDFDAASDPLILFAVAPVGAMNDFKSYIKEKAKEGRSKSGLPDFELAASDRRKLASDLSDFGKDPDLESILKFIKALDTKTGSELSDLQAEIVSLGGTSIFNFNEKRKINNKLKRFMALISVQSSFLQAIKEVLKSIDKMILKDDEEKPIILIRKPSSRDFLFEEKIIKNLSKTAGEMFRDSVAMKNLAVQSNSDWWVGFSKRLADDSTAGTFLPSFFGSGKEISEILGEINTKWEDLGRDLVITTVLCSTKQIKKIMSDISGASIAPISGSVGSSDSAGPSATASSGSGSSPLGSGGSTSSAGSTSSGGSSSSGGATKPVVAASITPIKTNDIIDSSLNWVQRKAVRKGARSNLKNKLNQALIDAGVVDGAIFENVRIKKQKRIIKESMDSTEDSFARMRKLAGLED